MIKSEKILFLVSLVSLIIIPFLFVHEVRAEEDEIKVYTLEESVSEALKNNWGIKAQEERIQESEYVKKQARSDFLPTVSTTYGYTRLSEVQRTLPQSLGGAIIPVSYTHLTLPTNREV